MVLLQLFLVAFFVLILLKIQSKHVFQYKEHSNFSSNSTSVFSGTPIKQIVKQFCSLRRLSFLCMYVNKKECFVCLLLCTVSQSKTFFFVDEDYIQRWVLLLVELRVVQRTQRLQGVFWEYWTHFSLNQNEQYQLFRDHFTQQKECKNTMSRVTKSCTNLGMDFEKHKHKMLVNVVERWPQRSRNI